jgi:uncharacterized glyoxalase superfamily protein PhnB
VTPTWPSMAPPKRLNGTRTRSEQKSWGEASPDGKLFHARIRIGDSIVKMSDIFADARHKDHLRSEQPQ